MSLELEQRKHGGGARVCKFQEDQRLEVIENQ
ncbi:hypothetical protein A2U01_0115940, partial [Trifolium medium]|nr:hypothetical protein [Trifolium medium]